jgi:integrase/recombinase XerD
MSEKRSFVSMLGPMLTRYLALKEALGRRYAIERAVLKHLDAFLAAKSERTDLCSETFAQWCSTQAYLTSGVRRARMRIVRNFCLYRRRTQPYCFVPDAALFPPLHQAVQPHIFTECEIAALLRQAHTLEPAPHSPLRREMFGLALVLLYTTGLRRGELLRLLVGDYDPEERTLLVQESKFHKSRLLPLSPDGSREIEDYLRARRARRLPVSKETPLLCSPVRGGRPYTENGFRTVINSLLEAAGIRSAAGRLPRLHDFRHTFAVHALLRWYRAGADAQAKLPFLATYMGHVSIVSTQYYLRFIDELAGLASDRFDQHCGSLVTALSAAEGGAS